MSQERLCRIKLGALAPDRPQAIVDRHHASALTAMEHLTDLRQAQPHGLTGLDDPQAMQMLVAVVAMS